LESTKAHRSGIRDWPAFARDLGTLGNRLAILPLEDAGHPLPPCFTPRVQNQPPAAWPWRTANAESSISNPNQKAKTSIHHFASLQLQGAKVFAHDRLLAELV
jgi:hypothetical protein